MCPSQLRSHINDLIQTQHFMEKKPGALERSGFAGVGPREGENQDPWGWLLAPGPLSVLFVGRSHETKRGWQRSLMSPGLAARTPWTCSDSLDFCKTNV